MTSTSSPHPRSILSGGHPGHHLLMKNNLSHHHNKRCTTKPHTGRPATRTRNGWSIALARRWAPTRQQQQFAESLNSLSTHES
jgi:hypothetical protein